MLQFVIYGKDEELPEGNCYIVADDGVYLKKNTGLISAVVRMEKVSCLKNIKPYATINIPPISAELFIQIKLFFKVVFELYASEAIVLLYFDEIKREYLIVAPYQSVSPCNLEYKMELKNNLKLVGSIHSHADFSAFHSITDLHDEANFDGLHITVGDVDQEDFSLSVEIAVNNNRFPQRPEDWILGIKEEKRLEEIKIPLSKPTFGKKLGLNVGSFKKAFLYPTYRKTIVYKFLNPVSLLTFPREWLDMVSFYYADKPKKTK
jgi:PRTRC genetic system protein A